MLTSSLLGRYLLWRAPSARDHRRFPSVDVGGGGAVGTLTSSAAAPLHLSGLHLPTSGRWPGESLLTLLQGSSTNAFVVLRSGVLAFEWYAPGWDGRTVGRTMSVTKSVASLMVGQAIGDGRLGGVDAPLGDLVAGIADAGVARLTLARLLRMDCGIAYREGLIPWHDDARVYHGSRLRLRAPRVRLTDPVGRYFHYNDWHPLLVALALERAGGASVAGLLARDLWGPLGGGPASLSLDRRGASALGHLKAASTQVLMAWRVSASWYCSVGAGKARLWFPKPGWRAWKICPTHGTRPSTSPTTLIGNCPGPVRWRAVATPTRTSGGTIVRRQARMICSRWAHSARMSTSPQTPTA